VNSRSTRILLTTAALTISVCASPAAAEPSTSDDSLSAAGRAELSETTRLADRRALVTGDEFIAMGDESGLYPASGWHTRGEMAGFWTPPVKLLDGMWFALDGAWLGRDVATARYSNGWGYQRFDYQASKGVSVDRVDFVPDGRRAAVIGLTLRSDSPRTVNLAMDAHSELMPAYPWGFTTPSNADVNLPDTGSFADGTLVFRENGTSPGIGAHDYAAVVGASIAPSGHALGAGHRGPQDPAVICPADGTTPLRCDDSATGRGTGGQLDYQVRLRPGQGTTVWFTVAGSDHGLGAAKAEFAAASRNPARDFGSKVDSRLAVAGRTVVDLPGDRLLQRSVDWSKQNLADSVQQAHDLAIRETDQGTVYPAPAGTVPAARWFGAGFPDYPWLFATDGEYTAFAAVAAGQFETLKSHLRALRDVSEVVNAHSGKVAHEVVSTGDVYFGTNADAGNTDETVKFPSVVALLWRWTGDNAFRDEMYDFAVRNLRYVATNLDKDGDGWPEGLGNVERNGMGVEKLDNLVYYVRGLLDLADLAASKGDTATASWAGGLATNLRNRFESAWAGSDANNYAESIDDPANPANDNTKIFQRHWIGVTPMEAELPGPRPGPLASVDHGNTALTQREKDCYTSQFGMFHTGTGPTSAPGGNPGASCDTVVSSVPSERSVFSLNTAVMAVGEGNFGRMGAAQQQRYTTGNARIQLDPSAWETPGDMPEIAPSPDFQANIDRAFTDRSMTLQAWGTYGILWPVVHQQLGVAPDLGHGKLSVIPQIPDGQRDISGRDIRLGGGSVDVSASRSDRTLRTTVRLDHLDADLTLGAVLPAGKTVSSVTLNGHIVPFTVLHTTRGDVVQVHTTDNTPTLVVNLR
jgi:hypothetical protein